MLLKTHVMAFFPPVHCIDMRELPCKLTTNLVDFFGRIVCNRVTTDNTFNLCWPSILLPPVAGFRFVSENVTAIRHIQFALVVLNNLRL
jgi:hypothetical protein